MSDLIDCRDDEVDSLPLQQSAVKIHSIEAVRHEDGSEVRVKCSSSCTNKITERVQKMGTSLYHSFVHLLCEHSCHGREKVRVYHTWPGNNVFFFKGHLVCGPDPRGLLITSISIIFATWIFSHYVITDFSSHSRKFIVPINTVLTSIEVFSLFMVSTRDPGILPRLEDDRQSEKDGQSSRIRSKRIEVNGVDVRIKFCRLCNRFRLDRSSHCATCDNCVEKFDHHCPLIGHCIGLRNYRYYLMFISSSLVLSIYILAFSCLKIWKKTITGIGFFKAMENAAETVVLILLCFMATLFIGGLVVYHVYLIMLNQTSYENYVRREMLTPNPYDKGILSNIKETLFTKLPPAKVNFRAEIVVSNEIDNLNLEIKSPGPIKTQC